MRISFFPHRERRGQKVSFQRFLLFGSAALLCICIGGLACYGINARRTAQINRIFQEVYESPEDTQRRRGPVLRQYEVTFPGANAEDDAPTPTPKVSSWPNNPGMTVSSALMKLRRQNRDIVGWLSIPDMLSQAVVQRDNTYYLKRDYQGYHNANGALFLEEGISLFSSFTFVSRWFFLFLPKTPTRLSSGSAGWNIPCRLPGIPTSPTWI